MRFTLITPQSLSETLLTYRDHKSYITPVVMSGAESRGSGVSPVEQMILSDICATHRSRVPRRSSGYIKEGVTTEKDEGGPVMGHFSLLWVIIVIRQSFVRG